MPLYIVATPIGNLGDITLRALNILREVKLIAAEDTRRTRQLLETYGIRTPLTSYHEHNKLSKLDYILKRLGEGDVALVSDAGMPGISDPGHELVLACHERGIPVVPIPGPSVITTALAVSGLDARRFIYLGFLPNKASARQRLLRSVANEPATIVILESPHRLRQALSDVLNVLGDRRSAVCRELTKLHEEVFRGRVSQATTHFTKPRGEFTLIIEGKKEEKPKLTPAVKKKLQALRQKGVATKEAVARVAGESGVAKKELYQLWLKLS